MKERYDDKISRIRKLDPYALSTGFSNEWSKFPDLTSDAVCHYLVHSVSFYTFEEFHAQKSLGAVNFVASDKVGNLRVRKIGDMFLIRAKVKHSYKESKAPLDVWVISNSIQVVSSHCVCVAGLREGCSHVGAVLFAVMFGRGQLKSVTDVPAYWVVPTGVEQAEQKRLKDIDFATPEKIMRRKLGLECESTPKKVFRPEASAEDFSNLVKGMWDTGHVGAIHLVQEPYAELNRKSLPHSLLDLYNKDNEKLSLQDLRNLGKATSIGWSKEERQSIAKLTIGQSVKRIWFLVRAGLVRGSLMKRCCRTNPLDPSVSLLKQVCYPHLSKFKSAATVYGCDHEEAALKDYVRQAQSKHVNFQTHKSGFNICEEVQFIGSSPDGFVSCDCHGKGCIEIKCPYCLRDASVEEILSAKTCLETVLDDASGHFVSKLKKDSDYYYHYYFC